MSFLISLAAFLIAIAVLVTFHEFGHYWVARRCGVKVLRFSVGFGRPLWCHVSPRTGTEWVVSVLPFGGYVKMLDKREAGDVPEALREVEFTGKPLYQRAAIIAAGPLFNLLLAFLLYSLVFMAGETGRRPLVGHVVEGSPAAVAGLLPGDEVLSVGGRPIQTWQAFIVPLLDSGLGDGVIAMEVRREDGSVAHPVIDVGPGLLKNENVFGTLGMSPLRSTSTSAIGTVLGGTPAEAAGLRGGDRIVRLDETPVATWEGMSEYIRARPGQAVAVEIERDGQRLHQEIRIEAMDDSGTPVGRIGVTAYRDPVLAERLSVVVRHPVGESLVLGAERTWDFSVLTVRLIGQLLIGGASVKNISGPVGIAEFAGTSAMIGMAAFLSMLALLSVSLGVLNLLPIPILDGGHLLYCLAEALTGRPVSPQVEAVGQRLGVAMLAALMGLALYNDLARLLG